MEEITSFIKIPLWNSFDEFGLLLGLERLPGETNREFRIRIYNAGKYFGSSTKQGIINATSVELGLARYCSTDKTFFFLTYQPLLWDPDTREPLSIRVWVNGEEWQDYDTDPTLNRYFRLWKLPNGETTRAVEISEGFTNGSSVKIVYYRIEDESAERWVDESIYPDETFIAYHEETPTAGQIEIFEINDPDFKERYFFDSDGNPNSLYESIVKQIHQLYPILWGQFIWDKTYFDVGDEKFSGLEYMPSRFDASKEFLASGDFGSGIGYGTDCAVYDSVNLSGGYQYVLIHPGYFYLTNREYYLYGQKCREIDPSGLYTYHSPIVVSIPDVSGIPGESLYYDDHFGETWMDERIHYQYLHVSDLSGCLSGDYDGMWDVPWFHIDQSGNFTISGDPAEYLVEYDISGYYEFGLDFNPCHHSNISDRFLVIREEPLVPWRVEVTYVDGYLKRAPNLYDPPSPHPYPDNDLTVRVDVYDQFGALITDPEWTVRLILKYHNIIIGTITESLDEDGSFYHNFENILDFSLTTPEDILATATLLLNGIETTVKGYLTIPVGL